MNETDNTPVDDVEFLLESETGSHGDSYHHDDDVAYGTDDDDWGFAKGVMVILVGLLGLIVYYKGVQHFGGNYGGWAMITAIVAPFFAFSIAVSAVTTVLIWQIGFTLALEFFRSIFRRRRFEFPERISTLPAIIAYLATFAASGAAIGAVLGAFLPGLDVLTGGGEMGLFCLAVSIPAAMLNSI